jgi:hypothetical protein
MSSRATSLNDESLEMYKTLHEERVSLGEETRKLEVLAVTAVAALYAWLATNHVHGAPWYIGVPLVAVASFRAAVLGERTLIIKEYLKTLEGHLFPDRTKIFGYEHFNADATGHKWYKHLRYTSVVIWFFLFVVTIFAPRFLDK